MFIISRDDVIKWKHFPRYWPFVRGIHRSPVNFPHKGQWRGALMFSLICVWINDWANNREAGDLRRYRALCDVIVMTNPVQPRNHSWLHYIMMTSWWKHFSCYWPFVWRIHRSPVNFPHKGHWRGALMVFFYLRPNNSWENNGDAGNLRCHRAPCDVIVMCLWAMSQRDIVHTM